MSSAQDRFLNANHGIALPNQLDLGIRGLLIDAYLGQRNDQGVVRTDLAPKAVTAVEAKIGPQGLAAAQRLAGSVAFGPVSGPKKLYLCHIICEFGATEASKGFGQIKDWLDLHPRADELLKPLGLTVGKDYPRLDFTLILGTLPRGNIPHSANKISPYRTNRISQKMALVIVF